WWLFMSSCCGRRVFWGGLAVLFLLACCSVWFSGEIFGPVEGLWKLNTLGRDRHLLQAPPVPDFLPSWLNPPLFTLSLFSSAGIIVKVVDVMCARIERPLRLFVWYASIHFFLIMALWFFGCWGSVLYSMVLLSPFFVILS